jgi:tubulin polyglutamylase TTLL6/13
MGISLKARNEAIAARRQELQQRMITGKMSRLTLAERKEEVERLQRLRDLHEAKHIGHF